MQVIIRKGWNKKNKYNKIKIKCREQDKTTSKEENKIIQ